MPTPPVPDNLLQQSLDWVEQYGSGHNTIERIGKTAGISAATIARRSVLARVKGMRPSFNREAPRIHSRERLGRMHIVIPDVQGEKPGVPLDHLTWVGNYIAVKKPDTIICIGDFADMESLSKYDIGTMRGENKRLQKDLQVARTAMDLLFASVRERR